MKIEKEKILVNITFRSVSGKSLHDSQRKLTKEELSDYIASEETRSLAIEALENMGFEVTDAISEFGASITGTKEKIENVFGDIDKLVVPKSLSQWIDKAIIPSPGEFLE